MKLLYLGDNSDSLNWGCRTTSLALRQLIGRHGEVIGSVPTALIARNWPVSGTIGDRPYAALASVLGRGRVRRLPVAGRIARGVMDALGTASAITHDVEANLAALDRARAYSSRMRELFEMVGVCDAVVVNGEGDLIFGTPARQRLLFMLTVCQLALDRGKKLFYLNAMASPSPDSPLNRETIEMARRVLAKADAFSLRDDASFAFAAEHRIGDPARRSMHPDAVFSWAPLFAGAAERFEASRLLPFFERTGHAMPDICRQPYIVVGGSSRSAYEPQRAVQRYTALVLVLQQHGLPIALAPGCTGDLFLKRVAGETGAAMLPIGMPILACAAVLANARAFVSGRWHPSIMASLGGTPCVFMGSNSHKTLAIQHMLGYPAPKEYSPWPTDAEIDAMSAEVAPSLAGGASQRAAIASRAAELGRRAEAVADCLDPAMAERIGARSQMAGAA